MNAQRSILKPYSSSIATKGKNTKSIFHVTSLSPKKSSPNGTFLGQLEMRIFPLLFEDGGENPETFSVIWGRQNDHNSSQDKYQGYLSYKFGHCSPNSLGATARRS